MFEVLTLNYIKELAGEIEVALEDVTLANDRENVTNTFLVTYSAMANTNGGDIFLGIKGNLNGELSVAGIKDPNILLENLWTALEDRERVSVNLLSESMVELVTVDEKRVIKVSVPRAFYSQLPVYVGSNPLSGTYQRYKGANVQCDQEVVLRMITASRMSEIRGDGILPKHAFTEYPMPILEDLDVDAEKITDV